MTDNEAEPASSGEAGAEGGDAAGSRHDAGFPVAPLAAHGQHATTYVDAGTSQRVAVAAGGSEGGRGGPSAGDAAAAAPHVPLPPRRTGSRDISCYRLLHIAGEGTYGKVYIGEDPATGDRVAIKQLKMEQETEGAPITALREIKALQEVAGHPNVVRLREVVVGPPSDANKMLGDTYMVFDAAQGDLAGLIGLARPSADHARCYAKQLFRGLAFLHSKGLVHRDLKPANLLLSRDQCLRIADFGLIKRWRPALPMTHHVVTLWYRAPELLLGERLTGCAVDMWSAGVVLLDLLYRGKFMQHNTEVAALTHIFSVCGFPTKDTWPGVEKLDMYRGFVGRRGRFQEHSRLRERYGNSLPPLAMDLVERLLTLNPAQRITAAAALEHPWFAENGGTPEPHSLPPIELDAFFESTHKAAAEQKGAKGPQQQQQQQHSPGKAARQAEAQRQYNANKAAAAQAAAQAAAGQPRVAGRPTPAPPASGAAGDASSRKRRLSVDAPAGSDSASTADTGAASSAAKRASGAGHDSGEPRAAAPAAPPRDVALPSFSLGGGLASGGARQQVPSAASLVAAATASGIAAAAAGPPRPLALPSIAAPRGVALGLGLGMAPAPRVAGPASSAPQPASAPLAAGGSAPSSASGPALAMPRPMGLGLGLPRPLGSASLGLIGGARPLGQPGGIGAGSLGLGAASRPLGGLAQPPSLAGGAARAPRPPDDADPEAAAATAQSSLFLTSGK